jgi:hypothetical protein
MSNSKIFPSFLSVPVGRYSAVPRAGIRQPGFQCPPNSRVWSRWQSPPPEHIPTDSSRPLSKRRIYLSIKILNIVQYLLTCNLPGIPLYLLN